MGMQIQQCLIIAFGVAGQKIYVVRGLLLDVMMAKILYNILCCKPRPITKDELELELFHSFLLKSHYNPRLGASWTSKSVPEKIILKTLTLRSYSTVSR